MKCTKITLKWKEKEGDFRKELDRQEVLEVFRGLVKGFSDDNEISKQLVEIIPEVDEIHINRFYNSIQDVPLITYYINGKENVLKIIRYHKIVWSILDKYCTE